MKTSLFKITAIVLFLTASAFSCEKEKNCKSGNCVSVNIKGSLRVKPSGEGLNNIPVEVTLVRVGVVINANRKVGSGRTNKNGEFDFTGTIDKSFDGTYFHVSIPEQKDYIIFSNYLRFWGNDYAILRNINFELYNKASLTINFNRTQTDVFDSFVVVSEVKNDNNQFIVRNYHYITNPNQEHAIRQVETAADVYTKIWWWKMLNGEEISKNVDSLICKQNSNNVFNINY